MKVGSLFSGIGGFDLAFERAGFEIAWAVEADERCRDVLSRHWPRLRLHDDVRTVHAETVCGVGGCSDCLPAVDVLVGGWPCQDLSVAGRRAGLAGSRSSLWWEFHRLASELRPTWIVGENVPGLLSSNGGRDMGAVLGALADIGYGYAYRVLDAQHFGVPQRRRRVFIVGHPRAERAAQVLLDPEGREGNPPPSKEAWTDAAGPVGGGPDGAGRRSADDPNLVAATLASGGNSGGFRTEPGEHLNAHAVTTRPGRRMHEADTYVTHTLSSEGADASEDGTGRGTPIVAFAENQRGEVLERDTAGSLKVGVGKPGQGYPAVREPRGVRRLTPRECERLQGFPDDWTADQPDSVRYRQIGNAVAVPVVEWIARRIKEKT